MINNEIINKDIAERRKIEVQAFHELKKVKENNDTLYLIDEKWIQHWVAYLRG